MHKGTRFTISHFVCEECGMDMPLPRNHGQQRGEGHIKTMYCAGCDKVTDFTEIRYIDFPITLADKENDG